MEKVTKNVVVDFQDRLTEHVRRKGVETEELASYISTLSALDVKKITTIQGLNGAVKAFKTLVFLKQALVISAVFAREIRYAVEHFIEPVESHLRELPDICGFKTAESTGQEYISVDFDPCLIPLFFRNPNWYAYDPELREIIYKPGKFRVHVDTVAGLNPDEFDPGIAKTILEYKKISAFLKADDNLQLQMPQRFRDLFKYFHSHLYDEKNVRKIPDYLRSVQIIAPSIFQFFQNILGASPGLSFEGALNARNGEHSHLKNTHLEMQKLFERIGSWREVAMELYPLLEKVEAQGRALLDMGKLRVPMCRAGAAPLGYRKMVQTALRAPTEFFPDIFKTNPSMALKNVNPSSSEFKGLLKDRTPLKRKRRKKKAPSAGAGAGAPPTEEVKAKPTPKKCAPLNTPSDFAVLTAKMRGERGFPIESVDERVTNWTSTIPFYTNLREFVHKHVPLDEFAAFINTPYIFHVNPPTKEHPDRVTQYMIVIFPDGKPKVFEMAYNEREKMLFHFVATDLEYSDLAQICQGLIPERVVAPTPLEAKMAVESLKKVEGLEESAVKIRLDGMGTFNIESGSAIFRVVKPSQSPFDN
ncbi:MAG: hypothetical protein MRY21_05155 [Simkaniaceae bacterium]|nr:hypothetical protein [Simkaniaceae bacterium]